MKAEILLVFALCALALSKEHGVTLDAAEKFHVSWSFDDTTPSSEVTFTVSAVRFYQYTTCSHFC